MGLENEKWLDYKGDPNVEREFIAWCEEPQIIKYGDSN